MTNPISPSLNTSGFGALGLPETLLKALEKIGFETPTPIQTQAIPLALAGRDILGSAATGTGKTAAFGLPLLHHLINNPKAIALVMTPTRELAQQVLTTILPLTVYHKDIRSALLIGGDSMQKQLRQLQSNPRLIVGTPGRINDHLARRTLSLTHASFLVLDETDRMLDMGFGVQIERIAQFMPKKRQTLLFSATLPNQILKLAAAYQTNPARISVDQSHKPAAKIVQDNIRTTEADKFNSLMDQIEQRDGSIIIFVKTKYGTERLAKRLRSEGQSADAIHGDLRQRQREKVIEKFRDQHYRILVATDVAARGLDIPHIEHVINYDLPQCPEDYIHRIGRTARNGAEGCAVNLLTPADGAKWKAISRLMNPEERDERQSGGERRPAQDKNKYAKKRPFRHRGQGSHGGRPQQAGRSDSRSEPRSGDRATERPAQRSGEQRARSFSGRR